MIDYNTEIKLENLIDRFKEDIDGLPLDDVLYYQEEFEQMVYDEYGIEIIFEDGDVYY